MNNTVSTILSESKELIRKYAEKITGWQVKDTNIKRIKVKTFSNRIKKFISSEIAVGEELDLNLSNMPHESVLAIFESNEYLVVTPDRNNSKGTLYLFKSNEVLDIEK